MKALEPLSHAAERYRVSPVDPLKHLVSLLGRFTQLKAEFDVRALFYGGHDESFFRGLAENVMKQVRREAQTLSLSQTLKHMCANIVEQVSNH